MKCKICEKEFKIKSIAIHIKRIHKLNAETYYNTYINSTKGICIVCGKSTNFKSIRDGYLNYCSERCHANHYWSTNEGELQKEKLRNDRKNKRRPKLSKLMKLKYKDPSELKKLKDAINTTSCKEKRRITMIEIWKDSEIRKRYIEGRKKYRQTYKAKENFRKHANFMKNGGAVYAASYIKKISKPQIELFNIIKKIFSTAKLNYIEDMFLIDIAIPQLKIAFEYDCWYWHQDKKKDNDRQNILESMGWSFIRYLDYIPSKEQIIKDMNSFLFI